MKYNTLIPELTVKNIERTKSFYVDIQGFDIEFERAEDKFVFLSFRDAQMMFEQFHSKGWNTASLEYPFGRGINFEIGVDNLDLLYERVLRAGVKPYRKLKANVYRVDEDEVEQREFIILDPDGYMLRFVKD